MNSQGVRTGLQPLAKRARSFGGWFFAAMAVLLVSACATKPSLYAPALEDGDIGYTETRLGEGRYRVVFKGDWGTSLETVQDYALLRAAELTVSQNFAWFEVAERTSTPIEASPNTAKAAVQVNAGSVRQTNCGLIGCTVTEAPSAPAFPQSELEFSTREQSYIASLEVLMGTGNYERAVDIYDAGEVIASIRAQL